MSRNYLNRAVPSFVATSLLLASGLPAYAIDNTKQEVEAEEKAAMLEKQDTADKSKSQISKYMSDTWIEAKLATTYALSHNLSMFDIDTEVRSGKAYLGGMVATEVEKELAAELAKTVDGVKSIENNISVSKSAKRADASSKKMSFSERVADLGTTATVKTKLLAETEVSGLDIEVTTQSGKVTLSGIANSAAEKELAETLAKNTDGVIAVNNKIEVNTAQTS